MGLSPSSMIGVRSRDLFRYPDLAPDEVRTLIIEPGHGDMPLRGVLERHKIGDPEKPYIALSYVWGKPKRKSSLQLAPSGRLVNITKNAEIVLLNVRERDRPQRVWIDGICINQEDVKERSHQVTLMGAIFSGASSVLIWLGEADEHTGSVFDFFERMHQRQLSGEQQLSAQDERTSKDVDGYDHQVAVAHAKEGEDERPVEPTGHEHDNFARIQAFSERPWFSRAWTFQEACLSADTYVRCGQHQLAWQTFVSAALYLNTRGMSGVFGSQSDTILALAHFAVANPARQEPFLSVALPLTRNLQSTDPRDKVFSLLGMVCTEGLGMMSTSYQLPVADIYCMAAKATIAQERGLSVLSSAGGRLCYQSLPSWVPDWRVPRRTAVLHGYDWPSPSHLYNVNQGSSFENEMGTDLGSDPRVLRAVGARIDKITRIVDSKPLLKYIAKAPPPGSKGATVENLKEWMAGLEELVNKTSENLRLPGHYRQTVVDTDGEDVRPGSITEAFMQTLTASRGGVGDNGGAGTWRTVEEVRGLSMLAIEHRWYSGDLEDNPPALTELELTVRSLVTAMWTFLNGRKIFKTSMGLLGIVADGAKVGDEVWDLVGGNVPFVLRARWTPFAETQQSFFVVGESYVHGIMQGGLWKPEGLSEVPGQQGSLSHHWPLTSGRVEGDKLEFELIHLV